MAEITAENNEKIQTNTHRTHKYYLILLTGNCVSYAYERLHTGSGQSSDLAEDIIHNDVISDEHICGSTVNQNYD